MAPLLYTLGLDAGGFLKAASSAISVMGSMELAIQGIGRAAEAMASAFNLAADVERTTVAIDTITKSAKVTTQVMGDLRKLAADTPFEMSDLAPAARMLLGAGTAAKDVAKQLRTLGDVASGADTDLLGLVTVFNQVRGKGRLLSDDFSQLAERGVAGLREEIAKLKGISVSGVADALSAGAVSARDLEAVLVNMTSRGGISFQAMERQAQTFSGKLSTLRDAWSSLQVAFAAPINDALKPVIDDITGLTEALAPAFGVVGAAVSEVVSSVHAFVSGLSGGASATGAMAEAFGGLLVQAKALAAVPIESMLAALPGLGQAFLQFVIPVGDYLFARLEQAARNFTAIILSELASVFSGSFLTAGLGESASAAARVQSDAAQEAGMRAEGIGNVDIVAGFAQASASLTEAAAAMRDTFNAGVTEIISKVVPPASAPEAVQGSYDGRYAFSPPGASTMAGIQPASAAKVDTTPQKIDTLNSTMREVVGELRRINTQ